MNKIDQFVLCQMMAFRELRFQKQWESKQEIFHHLVEMVDTDIIYLELHKN